jgi:acetylornithine deacetylase/succinyl-diaminopimelate desuccinylase-like protein
VRSWPFAERSAAERGLTATYVQRQSLPATRMDPAIVAALDAAAVASGEPHMTMISGAAHDTMCVAARTPAAMLFVPCRDGLSHIPAEHAEAADGALGAEVMLNAIRELV